MLSKPELSSILMGHLAHMQPLPLPYFIHMFDDALNRKDQKPGTAVSSAVDTDDEPEVLESVEVNMLL